MGIKTMCGITVVENNYQEADMMDKEALLLLKIAYSYTIAQANIVRLKISTTKV